MAETKEKEFFDAVVSVRRVTKVTKGGKRFSFSAFVISGDQKGNIGIAVGKSKEVSSAIAKATTKARKSMIAVTLRDTTIPYNVKGHHGSSTVIIRSAYKGTGVIAGGPLRPVMDALGVKDVLAKSLGSGNQINVVKATLNALAKLRSVREIAHFRGKTVEQVIKGSHVTAA